MVAQNDINTVIVNENIDQINQLLIQINNQIPIPNEDEEIPDESKYIVTTRDCYFLMENCLKIDVNEENDTIKFFNKIMKNIYSNIFIMGILIILSDITCLLNNGNFNYMNKKPEIINVIFILIFILIIKILFNKKSIIRNSNKSYLKNFILTTIFYIFIIYARMQIILLIIIHIYLDTYIFRKTIFIRTMKKVIYGNFFITSCFNMFKFIILKNQVDVRRTYNQIIITLNLINFNF
jgi:hypothetical protein